MRRSPLAASSSIVSVPRTSLLLTFALSLGCASLGLGCASQAPAPRAPTAGTPEPAAQTASAAPVKKRPRFGLSGAQIRPVLARMDREISGCYAMEYGGQENRGGRFVIEWMVAPSGTVEEASLNQSTFQNPAFEDCVVTAARGLSFPEAQGPTAVRKPYALSRRSDNLAENTH
jgi:hypothetical protein